MLAAVSAPRLPATVAVAALLVPWLAPYPASAQDFDAIRPRGGGSLNAGGMVFSGAAVSNVGDGGIAGFQGQLGMQAGDHWAVYAMPEASVFFARNGIALNLGAAAMLDYTFDSFPVSFGGGCYLGALSWVAVAPGDGQRGGFVGPQIRSGFYPVIVREDGGARRGALFFGVDLGMYRPLYTGGFVFASTVSVGLQRF